MRTKVTLVLVFLNVALFFFIFRFERDWRTERQSMEARHRVLGSEAADIRHLEVSFASGGESYTLDRHGENWTLTSPIEWPANAAAVQRIVNELQLLTNETSFSTRDLQKNGQSLADYGLEHPRMTVTFTSGEPSATSAPSPTTILQMGDATKVGNLLYILSPDGSRIHVVSRSLADNLSLPVDQLRSESILTIPVFEARSLGIQATVSSGVRVRVRRDDNGRWAFETPLVAPANKVKTEMAINSLDSLKAKAFVTQNLPAQLPSASPLFRVSLEGNNRQEVLLIGGEVPGAPPAADGGKDYYAQLENRPALFTVEMPPPLLSALINAQDELRDPHVLDFDPHSVTSVTLSAPNEPDLTLQRLGEATDSGAGWQIVRKGGSAQNLETIPADKTAVTRLLDQLALLSAEKFGTSSGFQSDAPTAANIESWGFNQPERKVTLALTTPAAVRGQTPQSTTIGLEIGVANPTDSFAYARTSLHPFVFSVGRSILTETPMSPLSWRERQLRQLPASAKITALTLTRLADNSVVYAHKLGAAETWDQALAVEPADRRKAVADVIAQLKNLHAMKFVHDGFTDKLAGAAGEDRPWVYKLDTTISLPTGSGAEQVSSSTLWLLDRTGASEQFAGSQEFGADFLIDQPFLDALRVLTDGPRDPGVVPTPPKS